MIDFIKINVINTNIDNIEVNPLLDFMQILNTKTGELNTYKNAIFKGLEFKIYEPNEKTSQRRLTIEGSLHKYWNNGAHNFNDFGIYEILEVLEDLRIKFKTLPENCVLRQLEIGVNINPPVTTKTVLKGCLKHKNKDLKWVYTNDEGNYIQATNQRHFIKIYDKCTHYKNKGFDIDNPIMRIEKKWRKMVELNNKGIHTIQDLINYNLLNFKNDLLKEWNNVLYCDYNTVKGTKNEDKYTNVIWWERLNYDNFKYHRNQLNKLIKSDPKNIKNIIAKLIDDKAELLNTKTTEINSLYIGLKKEVDSSQIIDMNRRSCLVTGLNISMQKKNSFLLSHTGLKYYFKTDKKIFLELKRKYLTTNWANANHKKQIKEIAHCIRRKHQYNKVKQIDNQLQLFIA